MLQEETLREVERRKYEEPEGELIEVLGTGTNTVTVLTRVESENARIETPPIDPDQLTVSEIQDALGNEGYDWNQPVLLGLLEAEKEGKNRTTAINAIEERLQ
jgi:hypothetical protein